MAKILLSSITPGDKEGWLIKSGGSVKSWKRRWAVLKGDKLYYFKAKKDTEAAKGAMELSRESFVKEDPTSAKRHCIAIGTTKRVYFMHFDTAPEMHAWIAAIGKAIGVLTGNPYHSSPIASSSPGVPSTLSSTPSGPNKYRGLLSGTSSNNLNPNGGAVVPPRAVTQSGFNSSAVESMTTYDDKYGENYDENYDDPYGQPYDAHDPRAMLDHEDTQEEGDGYGGYHDDEGAQESMFDFDEATGTFVESSSFYHEPQSSNATYGDANNYNNVVYDDNGAYYDNGEPYEGDLCRESFYKNKSKLLNAEVCAQCAGNGSNTRCVVCGDVTAKFQLAGMCDDCFRHNAHYCMICGADDAQHRAYLCSYCDEVNKGTCTQRKY